jgi:hypothetical protein
VALIEVNMVFKGIGRDSLKWISVKDRLPDSVKYHESKRYLIFEGYCDFAYWVNDEWSDFEEGWCKKYHPTHWAELPEPPKD